MVGICTANDSYSISNTGDDGPVKNQVAKAIVERIIRAGAEGKKFRIVVVIPEVPGFAGQSEFFDLSLVVGLRTYMVYTVKDETSVQTIMAGQYRTMNRGGHSIYEEVRRAGYEP